MALLYKFVVGSNWLIIVLALVVVGFSAYGVYEFEETDSSTFDRETYLILLIGGLFTIIGSAAAICGVKYPEGHSGALFCYYNFMIFIIMLNGIGMYVFVNLFDTLEAAESDGSVSNAVNNYAVAEIQDYILSTYTTCCVANFAFCNNVSGTNCTEAVRCDENADAGGIGQGCYTSADEIPPFTIGESVCTFLEDSGSPSLVGPPPDSCGGGDPAAYVQRVIDYIQSYYYAVLVPWSILFALLSLNCLGAAYYNVFPDRYRHGGPASETVTGGPEKETVTV